jgi:hypothetical protein
MGKIENLPTWKCDRCGKEKQSKNKPNSASDPWGHLKINQDSGWDYQGHPWAPRMRGPMLLCGDCIEDVFSVLTRKPCELQHHFDTTVGLWATDNPDALTDEEKKRCSLFKITAR